jgi:hypothetical protein
MSCGQLDAHLHETSDSERIGEQEFLNPFWLEDPAHENPNQQSHLRRAASPKLRQDWWPSHHPQLNSL